VAPVTTRAVLLRAYPYGETSRVLRFYTDRHGLLGVMARGVRGRSAKGGTTLATFASGDLTVYVKPQRDLQTMKDFACTRLRGELGSDVLRFAGASMVAELVLSHADHEEAHPGLFDALEEALDTLADVATDLVPTACLAGAWRVVDAFGYAPQLDPCVRCGRSIGAEEMGRFDFAAGGVRCGTCAEGSTGPRVGAGARAQLRALLSGALSEPVTSPRRHLGLLQDFVTYHVASKPLRSLALLGSLLPAEEDA